jgi:hypothetical protein
MNAPDNVVFDNDLDDCGLMVMLSRFSSVTAKDADVETIPWTNVVDAVLAPAVYPSKASQPLIKMATFGTKRTPAGSVRSNENLETISGVEIDHDAGTMSMGEAKARLESAGIKAVIYTSASHRPEKPRWRILAPCSEPRPAAERERLVARINGVLEGAAASESFTASQVFYIGRVQGVSYGGALTFNEAEAGACIDELPELDDGAIGRQGPTHEPKTTHRAGGTIEQRVREIGRPLREGDGRRALMLKIAGQRARRGESVEEIMHRLEAEAAEHFDPADPVDWPNILEAVGDIVGNDDAKIARLDGLVDRVRASGSQQEVFEPPTLEALKLLRDRDRGTYETLRVSLKRAGVRLTAVDDALRAGGEHRDERTHADIFIEILQQADVFRMPGGADTFADVRSDGRRETLRLRSGAFKAWLTRAFFKAEARAPQTEALSGAINLAEARALDANATEREVFTRVAEMPGRVYLDLGDATWRAVEVDAQGWRIVAEPPVRFKRSAGMLALPEPVHGGSIDALRQLVNIRAESDFVLAVGWLLATLRGKGPYPVLAVEGEHGAAKSSAVEILRALVDPAKPMTRSQPRDDRDLSIAASNGYIVAIDNLSSLPAWISDAMCRLSTGSGYATRLLRTDSDELILDVARPVALNGIERLAQRQDLADRAIVIELVKIPSTERKTKLEVMTRLEQARPAILGALLDGVAEGLRRLPSVKLDRLPRLADFATWVTACEQAFWPEGTFMRAYDGNRESSLEAVIEADEVAERLLQLVAEDPTWSGSATALLNALRDLSPPVRDLRSWPDTPAALSGRIKRAQPGLRELGLEIVWERKRAARTVTLTNHLIARAEGEGDANPGERLRESIENMFGD